MKRLGLNLTFKPGAPREADYWIEGDWPGWERPQLDCALALGCNIVRILGDAGMVARGEITQALYNTRVAQLAQYCADHGVALHYTGCSTFDASNADNGTVALPDSTIAAIVVSNFAAAAATGVVIPFCDIVQEANIGLSAARINNLYALVRPQIPASTLCSFSLSLRLQDYAFQDAITGSCDYLDLHIYPQIYGIDAQPTAGDVDNLLARYPAKSVFFGEGGINAAEFTAAQAQAWIAGFVGLCNHSNPRVLGGSLWAARDHDALHGQYGAFESNWYPRANVAGPWLVACRLGYIPVQTAPTIPPLTSILAPDGAVWTFGAGSQYGHEILRNGVQANGGQGEIITLVGGRIYARATGWPGAGDVTWFVWNGASWAVSAAP